MINKIKLNIISNRKLCENENLEKQIEKIFSAYEKKIILENFEIVSLTLREKDLNENEYLNLDEKYMIKGLHLSYEIFKSLNKNIREDLIKKYKRIGVSVHSLNEAKEVESLGASYVVAGHIFETDCKKGLEPRGLKFIEDLSSTLTIRIFAIGGINQENSYLAIKSGAFGVCMMSSLMKY